MPKTAGPDAPRVTLAKMGRVNVNKYSIPEVVGAMEAFEKVIIQTLYIVRNR